MVCEFRKFTFFTYNQCKIKESITTVSFLAQHFIQPCLSSQLCKVDFYIPILQMSKQRLSKALSLFSQHTAELGLCVSKAHSYFLRVPFIRASTPPDYMSVYIYFCISMVPFLYMQITNTFQFGLIYGVKCTSILFLSKWLTNLKIPYVE